MTHYDMLKTELHAITPNDLHRMNVRSDDGVLWEIAVYAWQSNINNKFVTPRLRISGVSRACLPHCVQAHMAMLDMCPDGPLGQNKILTGIGTLYDPRNYWLETVPLQALLELFRGSA